MSSGQIIKKIVIAVAIVIAVVGVYRWMTADDESVNANSTNPAAGQVSGINLTNQLQIDRLDAPESQGSNQPFKTGVESLPRSLQGTDVDGEIIIDGNKNLVPTRGLRRLYDYFLSALGEESADTIDARVEAYITSRTPEPAGSTAVNLYYQYKAYLKQLSRLQEKYGSLQMQAAESGELDLNTVRQRQYDINAIRNQMFDQQTIQAFFETDDQLQEYNIAMIEIANNQMMSEEEKRQARLDYVSRLPDSLIKQRVVQKENMETLMARTERLQKSGASDAELFAMRAELVGIPAAERLAEVDKKNRDFDARFEQYQSAKQQIISSTQDKPTQQNEIQRLEQQLFSDAEQKRLTGYERLKNQQQTN